MTGLRRGHYKNMKSFEQLSQDASALCQEVEKLPAGDQQTKVSITASNLAFDIRERLAIAGDPTGTEQRLCIDVATRQQFGRKKYGTSVDENPLTLRQWLEHAYYEALDHAVYLRRAIEEIDNSKL
jgi:hypothetical protein